MIFKNGSMPDETPKNFPGGVGQIIVRPFFDPKEAFGTGRLFGRTIIPVGVSTGYHMHEKDFEIYHVLSGTALYNDNGTEVPLGPGDSAICAPGTSHCIKNTGDEELVYIALILYPNPSA